MQSNHPQLKGIDTQSAAPEIEAGKAVLIDIREKDERAREWIPGSVSIPLSEWRNADLSPYKGKRVVVHCRSGNRTMVNAALFTGAGFGEAAFLEGGIEGWRDAGMPVQRNAKAPLEIMRQVQIIAGGLALAGGLAGYLVDPAYALVAAFVGAGLLMAGTTGWCGMARLLRHMPWNRQPAA
ncbi:rhodanese-like domain-containing protein [Nisaea acidiphila]|uniref:Rhodanese-like domain-containing protein n=1 Tax=Nisaea acidiphila TaxID=1862145 RepID=A0A9J7AWA7_9PROT|nr:rhodanese-like domain-containing protein [Nisaea acidiphila]UUX52083.1 rhodanese-like domain-containing protein [Nisaea acidiphila]